MTIIEQTAYHIHSEYGFLFVSFASFAEAVHLIEHYIFDTSF